MATATHETQVHIMDLRMARLGTAYPGNDSDLNTGMLSMMRCHYHFMQNEPKVSEFSTYASDDGKRRVFGPYIVRGLDRSSTKTIAINQFMTEARLIDVDESGTPVDSTVRIHGFPNGSKQVHFVGWLLDKNSMLEKLTQKMYRNVNECYRNDFMIVNDFPREEGWCICSHPMDDPTTPSGSSVTEKTEHAIQQHVTHCLRKRYVQSQKPLEDNRANWASLGPTNKEQYNQFKNSKQWYTQHPYFRQVKYEKDGNVIKLTKDEVKILPKDLAKAWKTVLNRTIQSQPWNEFNLWVNKRLENMYKKFKSSGYCLAELSLCADWTFYEKLKACVCPPVPISGSNSVPVQNLERDRQMFATHVRQGMYLVTKPRGTLADQLLVMNLTLGGPTFENMINHSGVELAVHEATQDRPSKVGVVRGANQIEKVLTSIAQICVVPYDSLVWNWKPREDEEEFSAWTLPQKAIGSVLEGL